jgi:hypothetical protein
MNPLLIVLNPRKIQPVLEAFDALHIERAYISGYTELELVPVLAQLVDSTDYTHYLVVSDDVIVSQRALDSVLGLLEAGHPVATAWCKLDSSKECESVNIVRSPLRMSTPTMDSYDFYRQEEVLDWPDEVVPTWFAGMAPQGMSRELWQQFPFNTYSSGWAGDYHVSWRLQQAGIPIVSARSAYTQHLKQRWNFPDSNPDYRLHLGVEHQGVRMS